MKIIEQFENIHFTLLEEEKGKIIGYIKSPNPSKWLDIQNILIKDDTTLLCALKHVYPETSFFERMPTSFELLKTIQEITWQD